MRRPLVSGVSHHQSSCACCATMMDHTVVVVTGAMGRFGSGLCTCMLAETRWSTVNGLQNQTNTERLLGSCNTIVKAWQVSVFPPINDKLYKNLQCCAAIKKSAQSFSDRSFFMDVRAHVRAKMLVFPGLGGPDWSFSGRKLTLWADFSFLTLLRFWPHDLAYACAHLHAPCPSQELRNKKALAAMAIQKANPQRTGSGKPWVKRCMPNQVVFRSCFCDLLWRAWVEWMYSKSKGYPKSPPSRAPFQKSLTVPFVVFHLNFVFLPCWYVCFVFCVSLCFLAIPVINLFHPWRYAQVSPSAWG